MRQFAGDDRGLSAVEFGLLAPLMVALYLGSVIFSQGIAIQRKTTMVAHSVADLVSQSIAITSDSDMTSILNAVDRIIEPYPKENLKIVISQVSINAQGVATIDWSDSRNSAPRPKNQVVTTSIPSSFRTCTAAPCYLIWGETEYAYVPVLGRTDPPPVGSPPGTPGTVSVAIMWARFAVPTLREQSFMRARQAASVSQTWAGKEYPRS
jgi:Flp pilus assembly protein TadG